MFLRQNRENLATRKYSIIRYNVTVKQQQRCLRPCLLEPKNTFYESPGYPALNAGKWI